MLNSQLSLRLVKAVDLIYELSHYLISISECIKLFALNKD